MLLFDALDRQLQQDVGMPHGYFEILVRLSESPARTLRMSELAPLTRSSRSRLSHAVARLEERGWVEREDCPTDRRGQIAQLTDAGFAVLVAAAPSHVDTVRRLVIDALTCEQIEQMTIIGQAILDGLARYDWSPTARMAGVSASVRLAASLRHSPVRYG